MWALTGQGDSQGPHAACSGHALWISFVLEPQPYFLSFMTLTICWLFRPTVWLCPIVSLRLDSGYTLLAKILAPKYLLSSGFIFLQVILSLECVPWRVFRVQCSKVTWIPPLGQLGSAVYIHFQFSGFLLLSWLCKFLFLTIQKTLPVWSFLILCICCLLLFNLLVHVSTPPSFQKELRKHQEECYIKLGPSWDFLPDRIRNHRQEVLL